jgi:Tol biopolymer transport system component
MPTGNGCLPFEPARLLILLLVTLTASPAAAQSRLLSSTLIGTGARVDWSPVRGLLVFDKTGADRYFDVYTMLPNGSAKTCLTCDRAIPQLHIGNPAWHPSGNYILFQVQDPSLPFLPPDREPIAWRMTNPGWGTNNNLWLMTADATQFWQLTSVAAGMGVLHPHFNSDGSRLTWAEKVGLIGADQQWLIKVADLVWTGDTPSLANIVEVQPLGIDLFYETHDWSPDDSKILFSAGFPSLKVLDLYTYELASGAVRNLTNSPDVWDEHAHYSPDGQLIVWSSSRDITTTRDYFVPFLDYWAMSANGGNAIRLTYFNDPGYPEHYELGLVTADFAFGPNSQYIIGSLEQTSSDPLRHMTYVISVLKLARGAP